MNRACRCQHLERDHRRSKGGHGSQRGECMACLFCDRFANASTERTALLRGIADGVFQKFEKHHKRTGEMGPWAGIGRIASGGFGCVPLPKHIDMNSGDHKDRLFSGLRKMAEESGADVVVFMSDAWFGQSIRRGAMSPERVAQFRGKSVVELEAAGLVTKQEVWIINVQTSRGWMLITRAYERTRDGVVWGTQMQAEGLPDEFDGRQKMFGKPPSEDIWHEQSQQKRG